jgi:hypothetical protein
VLRTGKNAGIVSRHLVFSSKHNEFDDSSAADVGATWSLIAISISACWVAWATSKEYNLRKEERELGFERAATWPPAGEFFAGEIIGLAYYIPLCKTNFSEVSSSTGETVPT